MGRQWTIAAMLALAGCASGGERPGTPVAIQEDAITYQTSPCFGACPVYSVTVRPNGTGVFIGKRFTAVDGERAFKATVAQYQAFASRLLPFRPKRGDVRYAPGEPNCGAAATDMPSVDVSWRSGWDDTRHLSFYFGCGMEEKRAMREALAHAPDALPIGDFIKRQPGAVEPGVRHP